MDKLFTEYKKIISLITIDQTEGLKAKINVMEAERAESEEMRKKGYENIELLWEIR